jgi:hypothetical protein
MSFIQGEDRGQGTLFPVTLEELIPEDHLCRVIEAFVGRLDMAALGFERAEPAETLMNTRPRPCTDCATDRNAVMSILNQQSYQCASCSSQAIEKPTGL